ncbi:dihydroorotate dehydrogenase [Clostridia bacterium]|nr:dihydroorotate dehydrogenase [Clostridia bacterium]
MTDQQVDLSIDLMGLHLKNPVMTASGTCGSGVELLPYMDVSSLGAIVGKGTTLNNKKGNPPGRLMQTSGGLLNCIGLQNQGVDYFLANILPEVGKLDTHFFANISGNTVEEYGILAEKLDVEGISGLEVNISCPNVKSGGLAFGTIPEDARAVTEEVKKHTSKKVLVKLSPNVTDITAIAQAVEDGGADGISLINTLLGMAIDSETMKASLSNTFGGLSGPAVKPVGLRMVYQVYQKVSIPIVGLGGIMNAKDAIEYMLAGATAIQLGTANLVNPAVGLEVIDGIERYMKQKNIKDIKSLVGKAHR